MSKTLKIIIGVVIGLLLTVIIVQHFQKKSLRKQNQIQSVELLVANDSARIYRTKDSISYSKLSTATIESNALKSSLLATGLTIKELRQKDIKWRNITDVLNAKLEVTGHVAATLNDTVYINSAGVRLPAKDFVWTNKYLSLSGLVKEKVVDIDYNYKINLSSITETKGKNTSVTIYTNDPNATITNGYQINVANKTTWYKKWYVWGVAGLVGGYFIAR
jgi:hypothetical protein